MVRFTPFYVLRALTLAAPEDYERRKGYTRALEVTAVPEETHEAVDVSPPLSTPPSPPPPTTKAGVPDRTVSHGMQQPSPLSTSDVSPLPQSPSRGLHSLSPAGDYEVPPPPPSHVPISLPPAGGYEAPPLPPSPSHDLISLPPTGDEEVLASPPSPSHDATSFPPTGDNEIPLDETRVLAKVVRSSLADAGWKYLTGVRSDAVWKDLLTTYIRFERSRIESTGKVCSGLTFAQGLV